MRRLISMTLALALLACVAACQSLLPPTPPPQATAQGQAVHDAAATLDSLNATARALQATVDSVATATPTITPTPDPFPTPVVANIYVAEQPFEGGWLFWLQPNSQIWLLAEESGGERVWAVYADTFVEGEAESDPQIIPPEGRFQPIRGFGKLWREQPEVRQTLGWATDTERGHTTRYEYHHGGSVNADYEYLPAPGYHLARAMNGEVFRFNEGAFTWSIES